MSKSDTDLAHSNSHSGREAIKGKPIDPAEESGLPQRVGFLQIRRESFHSSSAWKADQLPSKC